MAYDYNRFTMILQMLMESSWRDPDELEIGEDISDMSEVKIMFDGYGNLETEDEYIEGGDTNMESYAIFIHKDALSKDFVFPDHDVFAFTFGSMIEDRPAEEVCLYAWYDVERDEWDFIPLEDRIDGDNAMTEEEVMVILEGLYNRYFVEGVEMKPIMLTRVEHHQVNYHYNVEFTFEQLEEIFPDLTKKELKEIWIRMKDGDQEEIDHVMSHAFGEIDIEWDMEYEDNWTDRKGGYDITYGVK